MDSVTQILLGAAVGHATLGRQVGRKALLWGAVFGLAPDLDVFIPQPDAVSAVTEHRGFSHAVLVHSALAPVAGAGLARLHRADGVGAARWTALVWLALVTHALLDACTIYGTQLLWPSTRPPVGLGSIFIIDPLYTLPLLVAVAWAAARAGRDGAGARACLLALALSTGYLAAGIGVQQHVRSLAERSARAAGLPHDQLLVTPTPFNIVLWRVVSRFDGGYAEGYHSLLDRGPTIDFVHHASEDEALGAMTGSPAVERLRWFTRGFHRVSEIGRELVITDLRMGFEPKYVFSFVVGERVGDELRVIPNRRGPVARPAADDLAFVWARALGR